jgi:hypothetical protein
MHNKLLVACDGNYCVPDGVWSASAGVEGTIHPLFALRAGYKYSSGMTTLGALAGISGGLGFKFGSYQLDYAFVPYGDLGQTHRVSFLAKFK